MVGTTLATATFFLLLALIGGGSCGISVHYTALELINQYDATFNFKCKTGYVINRLWSEHSDRYEDRRWKVSCKTTPTSFSDCRLTEYVNAYDGLMDFECPNNGVLAGLYSQHSDSYEDRRFQFYCCAPTSNVRRHCWKTGYLNEFDKVLDVTTHVNEYIAGIESYHSDSYEDRRYAFYICLYY